MSEVLFSNISSEQITEQFVKSVLQDYRQICSTWSNMRKQIVEEIHIIDETERAIIMPSGKDYSTPQVQTSPNPDQVFNTVLRLDKENILARRKAKIKQLHNIEANMDKIEKIKDISRYIGLLYPIHNRVLDLLYEQRMSINDVASNLNRGPQTIYKMKDNVSCVITKIYNSRLLEKEGMLIKENISNLVSDEIIKEMDKYELGSKKNM